MEPEGLVRTRGSTRLTSIAARKSLSARSGSSLSSRSSEYATWLQENNNNNNDNNNNNNNNNKNNSILLSNRRSRLASSADIISLPPSMQVMGRKVTIYLNDCPSELRRPSASPYTIVQKYKKASYENKCYWAKVYEVEYKEMPDMSANNEGNGNSLQERGPQTLEEVMMNLCLLQGYRDDAENGSGSGSGSASKKSFVAATGDVIGLCAEAASAKDAVKALQTKLVNSILQCLDEGLSHCMPTKRNYQDVLLKDFEADMAKLRIKVLSPPTYHFMKITPNQLVDSTSGNGLDESNLSNQPKGEASQDK